MDPPRAFGSADALAFIRALAEDNHLSCLPTFEVEESNDDCFIHLFEALRRMMNPPCTPWWTRVWVVQEVMIPKDVIVLCSSISAPWSMFADAALALAKHAKSCCAKVLWNLPRDQFTVLAHFVDRVKDIEMLRKAHARAQNSMDIGRKFRTDLPSWVPDWDAPAGQTNDIRIASMALYRAPRTNLPPEN
ncbi:hypothetical protein DM02DRAFT_631137 [Periconia macrospinosa]|uniref:Heterokaryon incompatibility domain-containing protein n=1 Tax=Periconia macrospinosa TaxID=97972 RepID=A0A2V1DHT6_9PLEO|nr:hypothetical protein DM02DRAFT_631137 [Periconia macrospinosa]